MVLPATDGFLVAILEDVPQEAEVIFASPQGVRSVLYWRVSAVVCQHTEPSKYGGRRLKENDPLDAFRILQAIATPGPSRRPRLQAQKHPRSARRLVPARPNRLGADARVVERQNKVLPWWKAPREADDGDQHQERRD